MVEDAEAFILKKNLFRSVRTGEIINPDFIKFHYPMRWKYDAFRALEYFAKAGRAYDSRMQEAIELVIKGMHQESTTACYNTIKFQWRYFFCIYQPMTP